MTYVNLCCKIYHCTEDNPTVFEVLPLPVECAFCPGINTRMGVKAIGSLGQTQQDGNSGFRLWFDIGNSFVNLNNPPAFVNVENYAIKGDNIWVWAYHGTGSDLTCEHYSIDGTFIGEALPFGSVGDTIRSR